MYFQNFPLIPYDSVGNGQYKLVTNLLKRVALRAKVKTNTALFDTYDVQEGQTKVFKVGIDPEPGAVICNATADQQSAMDAMYENVASGSMAGDFGAIKGQAYGGG